MDEVELKALSEKAEIVAAGAQERTAAIKAEQAAEAELLSATIERIKPALRAISSRITKRHATTGGRNGCNPVNEHSYHEERGLLLIDNTKRIRDVTGNRGTYAGASLYLLSDGRLAVVECSGHWSHWQGEWDEEVMELRVVTAEEAMCEWELSGCIEAISKALDAQVTGNSAKVAQAAKARAEKLRSLASLMNG